MTICIYITGGIKVPRGRHIPSLKDYIYVAASLRRSLGFVKNDAKGRIQDTRYKIQDSGYRTGNGHHHIYQNKKRMAQIPLLIDIDSFNFFRIALKIGSIVNLLPVIYACYLFSWCHSWLPVLTMKLYVLSTICKKQHATEGFILT